MTTNVEGKFKIEAVVTQLPKEIGDGRKVELMLRPKDELNAVKYTAWATDYNGNPQEWLDLLQQGHAYDMEVTHKKMETGNGYFRDVVKVLTDLGEAEPISAPYSEDDKAAYTPTEAAILHSPPQPQRDERGLQIAWNSAVNNAVSILGPILDSAESSEYLELVTFWANNIYDIILNGPDMPSEATGRAESDVLPPGSVKIPGTEFLWPTAEIKMASQWSDYIESQGWTPQEVTDALGGKTPKQWRDDNGKTVNEMVQHCANEISFMRMQGKMEL